MNEAKNASAPPATVPWGPEAAFAFVAADFALILFLPQGVALAARFAAAGAFTLAVVLVWKGQPARLGFARGEMRAGAAAALLSAAAAVLLLGLGLGAYLLLRTAGLAPPLPPPASPHDPGWLRTAALSVLVYPALEEWIYRGILFPPLEARTGRLPAILLSGLVFQALHLAYGIYLPHYVVGGAILAFAFARGRSLLWPILLHAAWNLLVVAVDAGRAGGWIPF